MTYRRLTELDPGADGRLGPVAVWSLLASEPTHDLLTLAITGCAQFASRESALSMPIAPSEVEWAPTR